MANRTSYLKNNPLGRPQLNAAHPLYRNLVARWLFNENGGTKINDISGRYSNGVLTNGPIWNNMALSFDGVNDYVGTNKAITTNSVFTVSVWIYTDLSTLGGIISRDIDIDNKIWFVSANGDATSDYSSGNVIVGYVLTAGEYNFGATSNAPLRSGWNHIVAIYNSTAGRSLYVNNIKQTLSSSSLDSSIGVGNPEVRIGTDRDAGFFKGLIKNVCIYNRAISSQEVSELYVNPFGDILTTKRRNIAQSGGIVFDAASNSGYQAAQSTYSWSHTCTGSNRFLAVDVALLSAGQTVTGITYNGVALSLIGAKTTVTSFGRVECWGLANPSSGSNTIAVTFSGSIASSSEAVSYTGVHQTSPTEAFNSDQATNVGAADAQVAITSVANQCWIHAALATSDGDVTAGQTGRNEVNGAGGSGADEDFGPQSPGAKTMNYADVGALATWAIAGYAIRPVGSANLGNTHSFFLSF